MLPPDLSGQDRTTIGAYDDDGAVCGAVSMTQASDRMDLDWIFIMPQVRRRGIGSGLVAELSDYAAGNEMIKNNEVPPPIIAMIPKNT